MAERIRREIASTFEEVNKSEIELNKQLPSPMF